MASRKRTAIFVDTDFFNKTFEPSRKQAEKDLGIKLSQTKFTKILTNNGFKMNIPSIDNKIRFKRRKINEKSFTL